MDKELKDKIESLKVDAPVKKKKCVECKKKKEVVTKLPDVFEAPVIPSKDDIVLAYVELGSRDLSKREFINKVYKGVFDEEFDFGCSSCINKQSRKLKNYINEVLKIDVL